MKNYKFTINGSNYDVEINEVEGQDISLSVNGTPYKVTVDKEMRKTAPKVKPAATAGKVEAKVAAPAPTSGKSNNITSPLPGTILKVNVKVGDKVTAGQCVLMLEAMKMENSIESDYAGTVTAVKVAQGDSVMEGDVLVTIGD